MKVLLSLAAVALLSVASAKSAAAVPPPAWPVPNIKATGSHLPPVTGVTIGSFHVRFEATTFFEVGAALGVAPIGKQGDAGEFLMWVCYTLPAMRARIWLTSSELGGETYIDGMVAERLQDNEAGSESCPVPSGNVRTASLDNDVWLGESESKLRGALGTPNYAPGNIEYFTYEGKDGKYDVVSDLAVKIRKKKVVALYASHSATD